MNKKGAKSRPKPTPKQARAITLFKQEIMKGSSMSVPDILRKAGYAEESARQMTNVMAHLKPHIDPVVEWMEKHRTKVMKMMDEKMAKASYAELSRSFDTVTHYHQLLRGRPTANIALAAEVRHRIDHLIED